MAFRLLFWRRRTPASSGRHARATALAVPDSTGALVEPPLDAVPPVPPSPEPRVEDPPVGAPSDGVPPYDGDLDATAPMPALVSSDASGVPDAPADDAPSPADDAPAPEPAAAAVPPVEIAQVETLADPSPPPASQSDATPPVPAPHAPVEVTGVALGFADGASVELHPDDPRVTSFRAAAAALLDAHGA